MKTGKHFTKALAYALLFLFLFPASGTAAGAPSEIIHAEGRFIGVAEQIGNIASVGDYCVMQGGCVREDYGWFILLDRTTTITYRTTESIVVKYDMKTMEEVARSEMLKLGHGNDITYLEDTHELAVIHVNGKQLSILDPDTLEVKEKKKIPLESYALDYNPTKDNYVFAYGKSGMLFTNGLLKGYLYTNTQDNSTLVTQGICADDTYIYHVLWSTYSNEVEPDNIILVFDWEGNVVTRIPIGIKDYEPENISLVGDCFYIACNNLQDDGQALFKVTIEKAE